MKLGGTGFIRNIKDCVSAFLPLLNTEYEIVLGRKEVAVTLRIIFAGHSFRKEKRIIPRIRLPGPCYIKRNII